jgi:hypothetical protein
VLVAAKDGRRDQLRAALKHRVVAKGYQFYAKTIDADGDCNELMFALKVRPFGVFWLLSGSLISKFRCPFL